jgi:hypothetical protein
VRQRDRERDYRAAARLHAKEIKRFQREIACSDAPLDVKVTVDLQAMFLLALLKISRKRLGTLLHEDTPHDY